MTTTRLSHRQDLVEGIDTDGILDYLSQHGILDPTILGGLDKTATTAQKNLVILRHIEKHGNTAVMLLINALRCSWQLHMASLLDTEQRITPAYGNSYFGKDRHKGQLNIRIEIEALKILAPSESQPNKITNMSLPALLAQNARSTLDVADGGPVRDKVVGILARNDVDGKLVRDDGDEDFVKPRSCWYFCFSCKSKSKSKFKKDVKKQKTSKAHKQEVMMYQAASADQDPMRLWDVDKKITNVTPHKKKFKEKSKKAKDDFIDSPLTKSSKNDISMAKDKLNSKKSKSSKPTSKFLRKSLPPSNRDRSTTNEQHGLTSLSQVDLRLDTDETAIRDIEPGSGDHGDRVGEPDVLSEVGNLQLSTPEQSYTLRHQPYSKVIGKPYIKIEGQHLDKETWDSVIIDYDSKLELAKLRDGQAEMTWSMKQFDNNFVMCEQWKSDGTHFQEKASQLCDRIIQELKTEIIKHFEQERGILVLDVVSSGSAICVVSICMTQLHVTCLQREIKDGNVLKTIQGIVSKVDMAMFDIREVKLRISVDDQELNIVLEELS